MRVKKMNKYQRNYIFEKAVFDAIEKQIADFEVFVAEHEIVNSDGSVPEVIFCIEDETVFEQANVECSAQLTAAGLVKMENIIRQNLLAAENELIRYSMSIVPSALREVLIEAAATNQSTRQKLIDLALRLDSSTAPDFAR